MPQIHSSINEGDKQWLDRMASEDEYDESVSYLVNRLILRARMEYEFTDNDPFRIEDRHNYNNSEDDSEASKDNKLTYEDIANEDK